MDWVVSVQVRQDAPVNMSKKIIHYDCQLLHRTPHYPNRSCSQASNYFNDRASYTSYSAKT